MRISLIQPEPSASRSQSPVPLSQVLEKLGEFQTYYERSEPRHIRVRILTACLAVALGVCRALLAERGDCFVSLGTSVRSIRVVEPEGRAS